MPRYELDDGTLRRFWEISRSGAEITVRTGTIGEPGKARTKDHRTEARARDEEINAIRAMTRLGYVEVREAVPRPEALTRALAERTPDTLRVLADWLLDEGDPFGAVLAQTLAGAGDAAEAQRVELDRTWFASPGITADWDGGRPVALRVDAMDGEAVRQLEAFVRTPAGQILDRLALDGVDGAHALDRLFGDGPLEGLWHLRMSGGMLQLPRLGGLLPALRSIEVAQGAVELGAPRLPTLERLALDLDGAADIDTFGNVRHARMPALREIEIRAERPGRGSGRGFGEMLAHCPALRRASFRLVDLGGMVVPWLASGPPTHLERLELWGCRLTDADGTRLLQVLHAIPAARIDLDANRFSRGTADALAAWPNVTVHPRIADDEADYYDAVGE